MPAIYFAPHTYDCTSTESASKNCGGLAPLGLVAGFLFDFKKLVHVFCEKRVSTQKVEKFLPSSVPFVRLQMQKFLCRGTSPFFHYFFTFSFFFPLDATPPWRGERAWPTKRVARLSPDWAARVRLVIYWWIVLPIDFLLWVASRIGTWSGLSSTHETTSLFHIKPFVISLFFFLI